MEMFKGKLAAAEEQLSAQNPVRKKQALGGGWSASVACSPMPDIRAVRDLDEWVKERQSELVVAWSACDGNSVWGPHSVGPSGRRTHDGHHKWWHSSPVRSGEHGDAILGPRVPCVSSRDARQKLRGQRVGVAAHPGPVRLSIIVTKRNVVPRLASQVTVLDSDSEDDRPLVSRSGKELFAMSDHEEVAVDDPTQQDVLGSVPGRGI